MESIDLDGYQNETLAWKQWIEEINHAALAEIVHKKEKNIQNFVIAQFTDL